MPCARERCLQRAGAFLLTHASEAREQDLAAMERTLRRYNAAAPIFRCDHELSEFLTTSGAAMPA